MSAKTVKRSSRTAKRKGPPRRRSKPRSPFKRGAGRVGSRAARVRLFALVSLSVFTLAAMGFWGLWLATESGVDVVDSFAAYRRSAAQLSRAYSVEGEVIAEWGVQRRSVVELDAVAPAVVASVLASEDADYYAHPGLDWAAVVRALWADLRAGRVVQGGSTITQQVSKALYLTSERTWLRKWREAVIARKLEQNLSKRDILAIYLNEIYWGHGRYGVAEAARYYFGKDVRALGWAEGALLAVIIPAPERFSPFRSPRAATRRRDALLSRLHELGTIDAPTRDAAVATPLPTTAHTTLAQSEPAMAYYADAVRREVEVTLGAEALWSGGLTIRTPCCASCQRSAWRDVSEYLRELDSALGPDGAPAAQGGGLVDASSRLFRVGAAPAHCGVVRWHDREPSSSASNSAMGPAAAADGGSGSGRGGEGGYEVQCAGKSHWLALESLRRYLPPGHTASTWLSSGRIVIVSRTGLRGLWPHVRLDLGPQPAFVAAERTTARVVVLVGGDSFATHPFNNAVQARRQIGSTIKPLIWAAALQSGAVRPTDSYANVPLRLGNGRGGRWSPSNPGGFDGRDQGLGEALVRSSNTVSVQILAKLGLDAFADEWRALGLGELPHRDLSVALGSAETTPLRLLGAYAALAGDGAVRAPRLVDAIYAPTGELRWSAPSSHQMRFDATTRASLGAWLRRAVAEGTGKRAAWAGAVVAGKTGTTTGGRDAWFCGWTEQFVAVAWLGYDWPRAATGASGGRWAAPMWREVMRNLSAENRGRP